MKNLLFLSAAFAIALVACSKDKSEDLIEPMTKSGEVTTFAPGKQEQACIYFVNGRVYPGKLCATGFTTCIYANECGPLKK